MDGASDAELDFAAGEFVDNVLCIAQGSGQSVEFGHDQGVFLGGEVLVVGGFAGVSDEESGHGGVYRLSPIPFN